MKEIQTIAGTLIMVCGSFLGFAVNNIVFVLLSIVGGFILLALSKIIEILEEIHRHMKQPSYEPLNSEDIPSTF